MKNDVIVEKISWMLLVKGRERGMVPLIKVQNAKGSNFPLSQDSTKPSLSCLQLSNLFQRQLTPPYSYNPSREILCRTFSWKGRLGKET